MDNKLVSAIFGVLGYVMALVYFIMATGSHSAYRMSEGVMFYLIGMHFEGAYDKAEERERTARTDFRTFR